MKTILASAALSGALAAAAGAACAQTGGSMIIDQNRSDRAAPQAPTPSPPLQTGHTVSGAPAQIQPFVLRAVRLDSSSAPPALVHAAFRPFIGQRLDAAGLARLTQAASDAYAKTDIALYTIVLPDQDFADGVVRLRAVEGYVAELTVKDNGHAAKDLALARRYASSVLGERPLRASTLQRAILLIRDTPGLTADVQILREPQLGATHLVVGIKRRAFAVALGVNNQGDAELGRTQIEADLTANSLLRAGDQTTFTVLLPTDIRRFQYYAVSHSEPLGDGLTATASIGYLHTRPASTSVNGAAETASLMLSYPVIRALKQTFTVSGSLDGVNSDNALFGQSLSSDHTRALRASAAYGRDFTRTSVAVSATASFGLGILGARVTSPLLSDEHFKKLNLRVAIDRKLGAQWTLRLRGTGQLSGDRLPAVEQLPLGGAEFGRAFEAATITGDSGAAGSVELAFAPKALPHPVRGSEAYAFVDGGGVHDLARLPYLPKEDLDLASTGFGVRVAAGPTAVMQLEAAKAIDNPYPDSGEPWRVVFSVRSRY